MTSFFQRIFGRPKEPSAEEQAAPEPEDKAPAPDEKKPVPGTLVAGYSQSIGLQRDHNEDALFAMTTMLSSDETQVPFGLYIVADGMGGHRHGEIASGSAVRAVASYLVRKIYNPLLSPKPVQPGESIQEIMREGVLEAHRVIMKDAPGGGTTITAALVLGDQITITHIGDSRAYTLAADGGIQAITRDHSLVQRLVELGQITDEEAAVHPQRNVLYRALGQGEATDPDISTTPIPHSGYLLLCSDGLWGVVPEKKIASIITAAPTPQDACRELIDAANAAGGPDNITAILVRMPD